MNAPAERVFRQGTEDGVPGVSRGEATWPQRRRSALAWRSGKAHLRGAGSARVPGEAQICGGCWRRAVDRFNAEAEPFSASQINTNILPDAGQALGRV